jgi:hypothetical protein
MSKPASNNPSGFWKMILLLIIVGAAALMLSPVSADTGSPTVTGGDVTITRLAQQKYTIWEDTVTFSGTNTGSDTTYLFITGPNLKPNGAQIQSTHPTQSPVIDGDASTFQATRVGPDKRWSYTWDTHNVMIDSGLYTVYAASTPRDVPHINSTHFDQVSIIMAPPKGMAQPTDTKTSNGTGASAGTGVSIAASGTRSYYQGEKVVFSGHNYDSDTTYLFITGPGTFMTGPGVPDNGGKLSSPRQNVTSRIPGSFDTAKTNPDKSWEYVYYTHNLDVDAGTYSVYAVNQPEAKDQLKGVRSADVGIILKKPFIKAEITPVTISKGQPLAVTGFAEGNPEKIQIWILGRNYYTRSKVNVNSDASFRYVVSQEITRNLESGQNFVIVQHSMQNNLFDINVSGEYVQSLQLNNGTNLFRISGPGSLQGIDAADALVAAFSDPGNGDDTYTIIPFGVTDAESLAPQVSDAPPVPVPQATQHAPLQYAMLGVIIIVAGIVIWKRHYDHFDG